MTLKKNCKQIEKILLIYIEKLTGGISAANIFNISDEVKNNFQITEGIKHALSEAAQCVRGAERRLFMAKTVQALGRGGQRMVEKELKWNRQTIRKGMNELQSGFTCINYFSGRGRKPVENQLPNLHDDITDIVKPKTLADPTFRTTKLYTTLTATTVHKCLIDEKGYTEKQLPSVRTISTKLNYLNFNPQRVAKSKPIKRIKETEAIFQQVYKINRAADEMNGILRLSLDAKAKVDIGPFSRRGRSRQGVKGTDHDFKPEHILYPFGIFLPYYNQSYFYFTEGSVTADFMVDCLETLWPTIKTIYNPHTLVLNVDNGPENSSRRTQFIKRVVDFAYNNYVNIKLAYYPPYHSKYNPIERVWGVLERHWSGEILYSIEKTLGLARSMTYNGINPTVEMTEEQYLTGITLDKKEMASYEEKIIRLKGLEKWFVDIIVRSDYHFDSQVNLAS